MTPFGNFLEKIRRDRRLMQKQVAAVLGITPTRESGMERGRVLPPPPHVLQRLITGLELNETEIKDLSHAARITRRSLQLPKEMSTAEYEFIELLGVNLGKLSDDQLLIMTKVIQLGIAGAKHKK